MRALRLRSGWPIEEGAERLRLTARQLQRIEAGRANVTLQTLQHLADGFLLRIGDLVDDVPSQTSLPGSATHLEEPIGLPRSPEVAEPEGVLRAIGARLAGIRVEAGLSQTVLAGRAGVSKTLVRCVEAGRKQVTLHSFILLCNALSVDLASLLLEAKNASAQREDARPRGGGAR